MKTLKSLFGLFIIVAAVYVGWKLLPPYIANYRLEDTMDTTARFSSIDPKKTEDDIRNAVLRDAQSYNIDITPEQIQVKRAAYNEVFIWGDYTVRVDFPIHPVDLHFQPMSKNKRATM